jgi:hypothetical protein
MEACKPFIDIKENKDEIPDNLMMKLLKSKMINVRTYELDKREKRNVIHSIYWLYGDGLSLE